MGNVSLALPSIHPMIGINSLPAVNHQPEFTAHCVTAPPIKSSSMARSSWPGRPSISPPMPTCASVC